MALDFGPLPLVEGLAVTQREALHEVPAVQVGGRVEPAQAGWAGLVRPVLMIPCPGQRVPERSQVDLEVVVAEGDGRPVDLEPTPPRAVFQHRQGPAKGTSCFFVARFRPEQCRQDVATGGAPGDREICQEGGGLAGVDRERGTVQIDSDGSQEPDVKPFLRHADTVLPGRELS